MTRPVHSGQVNLYLYINKLVSYQSFTCMAVQRALSFGQRGIQICFNQTLTRVINEVIASKFFTNSALCKEYFVLLLEIFKSCQATKEFEGNTSNCILFHFTSHQFNQPTRIQFRLYSTKLKSPKFKRVSLNETLEFPLWCL